MKAVGACSILLLLAGESDAFAAPPAQIPSTTATSSSCVELRSAATNDAADSRRQFLSQAASAVIAGSISFLPSIAAADDEVSTAAASTSAAPSRSISACAKVEKASRRIEDTTTANCVSTSNVKEVNLYSPPWTYECSADEAFARLKGAVAADSSYIVTESDAAGYYLACDVNRGLGRNDEMEFLIKPADSVVTFKIREKVGEEGAPVPFGSQRRTLEAIRKSAGVFDVMGAGMTADSYGDVSKGRGGGALGQLKAFYGLQSGGGYEEVFDN